METPPGIDKNTTTHGAYWGGTVLPFWIFLVATAFPLTGFFGIDHLLFRSPSTAATKLVVNIFTLGLWYFYDIIQAFTDKDFIQSYGLSKPVVGPAGLAFNYFRKVGSKPDELPAAAGQGFFNVLMFVAYIFTIFLPFGVSNFIAGDTPGGIGKFILSMPLWGLFWVPFLFVATFYEVYLVLMKPEEIFEKGTWRAPPLNYFLGSFGLAKNIMQPKAFDKASKAAANAPGFISSLIDNWLNWILGIPSAILGFFGIMSPASILSAAKCACTAADMATSSGVPLPSGVDLIHAAGCPLAKPAENAYTWTQSEGKRYVEMGKQAKEQASNLVGQVAEIQTEVQDKMTAFTDPKKLLELAQKGGAATATESPYDWIFVGGILILISCGLGITVVRKIMAQKKNDPKSKTNESDSPPSPNHI